MIVYNVVTVTTCSINSKDDDATSICSVTDEPIHILNIAIATERGVDDDTLSRQFHEFVQEHKVCVKFIVPVREQNMSFASTRI